MSVVGYDCEGVPSSPPRARDCSFYMCPVYLACDVFARGVFLPWALAVRGSTLFPTKYAQGKIHHRSCEKWGFLASMPHHYFKLVNDTSPPCGVTTNLSLRNPRTQGFPDDVILYLRMASRSTSLISRFAKCWPIHLRTPTPYPTRQYRYSVLDSS